MKKRIFVDGSCYPNPGVIGGWAYIIQDCVSGTEIKRSGVKRGDYITNNVMELTAAIEGLSSLVEPTIVQLVTDSQYLEKGVSSWMHTWKKSGFRQKNGELWKEIYNLCMKHTVYVTWVRGHSGHVENEECDKIAGEAVKKCLNIKS